MGIDVWNHIWVGVFSAAFVQKVSAEEERAGIGSLTEPMVDRFTEESCALADLALDSYRIASAPKGTWQRMVPCPIQASSDNCKQER